MQPNEKLIAIRDKIDQIDDQLVPLLARRIGLALAAAEYKRSMEEIRSCDRVQQVLDAVARRAHAAGGDVPTVVAIYRSIIGELTNLQLRNKNFL